ncbi:unnamed protein product [Macrosiphum euphorbiae]|uniref:Uncharacterized protein n=1 Tax=Macrosiphum euphorbiae TaxID=13131 RepID=A0AAV0X4I4_9HEMI|nr:unnamed protein product [Macrosiphum euphorbiae]
MFEATADGTLQTSSETPTFVSRKFITHPPHLDYEASHLRGDMAGSRTEAKDSHIMTDRGNRSQRKRRSTPPNNTVKKGHNQTFSPPSISQTIPGIAPISQRYSPTSPSVAEETLSEDSFRSTTTEDDESSHQSSTNDHQPIPKRLLTTKPEYSWHTIAKSIYELPGHEYVEASTASKLNEINLNCPDEADFRSV